MPISTPVQIELFEQERAQLEGWARRRSSAQALAQRSRVVLMAAEGLNNTEIAQRLGVHRPMVRKWRSRFAEFRLDGLIDEPRPGKPRTISVEQVEQVIVKTLESTPKGLSGLLCVVGVTDRPLWLVGDHREARRASGDSQPGRLGEDPHEYRDEEPSRIGSRERAAIAGRRGPACGPVARGRARGRAQGP